MNRLLVTAITATALALGTHGASAGHYKVLHDFCVKKCTDGSAPWGPPVADGAGNYFGTASTGGGKNSGGAIYEASVVSGKWRVTPIYTFCVKSGCPDGSLPQAGLIIDTMGNLYGTTKFGGKHGAGTAFELSMKAGTWTHTVLHDFCSAKDCADGSGPFDVTLAYQGAQSGVRYDGTSTLFGTTSNGGASQEGTVFSLTPKAGSWTEKVIHDFCADTTHCKDGGGVIGTVTVDGAGNLFGVALGGGKFGKGVVYEVQPKSKSWAYTILHNFCADISGCADGNGPTGVLVADGAGNLYGTTSSGGAGNQGGTVFKLAPNGAKSKLTTLHSFCQQTNCTDGTLPFAGLSFGADGRLYGVTEMGGDMNAGTLFRLSGSKFTTFESLMSFGDVATPGSAPVGGLMLDSSGAFFGNTISGGAASNAGTLFRYTP